MELCICWCCKNLYISIWYLKYSAWYSWFTTKDFPWQLRTKIWMFQIWLVFIYKLYIGYSRFPLYCWGLECPGIWHRLDWHSCWPSVEPCYHLLALISLVVPTEPCHADALRYKKNTQKYLQLNPPDRTSFVWQPNSHDLSYPEILNGTLKGKSREGKTYQLRKNKITFAGLPTRP